MGMGLVKDYCCFWPNCCCQEQCQQQHWRVNTTISIEIEGGVCNAEAFKGSTVNWITTSQLSKPNLRKMWPHFSVSDVRCNHHAKELLEFSYAKWCWSAKTSHLYVQNECVKWSAVMVNSLDHFSLHLHVILRHYLIYSSLIKEICKNVTPPCRNNSEIRMLSHAYSLHMKILKHFLYY